MSSIRTVFTTPWFAVEEIDEDAQAAQGELPYYRIRSTDGVIVVPVTPEGKIVMVRQYRPAIGCYSTEVPAGGIETGEEPAEAAARELREETGYVAGRMIPLGRFRLMMNRFCNIEHGFLALDAHRDASITTEGAEVLTATPERLWEMIEAGDFQQVGGLGLIWCALRRISAEASQQG